MSNPEQGTHDNRAPQQVPAVGSPLQREVVRQVVQRAMRQMCWYCGREKHPLDDMHHLWCHGGNP